MQGMRPDAAGALRAFQDQAVDNVIAGHDLAANDRAAVLSYARYDALAELWSLIVEAFETPSLSAVRANRRWSTGSGVA